MSTTKKKKPRASHKRPKANPALANVNSWVDDPASGNSSTGGTQITRPAPNVSDSLLPISVPAGTAAGQFSPGTPDFRRWVTIEAAVRGRDMWKPLLTAQDRWQTSNHILAIKPDQGEDLNAFYDRVALNFFHADVGGVRLFSGESPDVVCHELGHAILDAIKPQLWNAAFVEAAAFHEAFGDMSALLSVLSLQAARTTIIRETNGSLFRSSSISRLAEQLGWGIRQAQPDGVNPDCLRNAVNSFFYREPSQIPAGGPASVLTSEAHSFSRVFTAAFMRILAGMFKVRDPQGADEAALNQAATDLAKLLIAGVRQAAVVPGFFAEVAGSMVRLAQAQDQAVVKQAFQSTGILSLPAAFAAISSTGVAAGRAAAMRAVQPVNLELTGITAAEIGIDSQDMPAIHVYAAPAVHGGARAAGLGFAGASTAARPVVNPSHQEAARMFVSELLQRGKVELPEKRSRGFTAAPAVTTPTHKIVKVDGDFVLQRIRIDCYGCSQGR